MADFVPIDFSTFADGTRLTAIFNRQVYLLILHSLLFRSALLATHRAMGGYAASSARRSRRESGGNVIHSRARCERTSALEALPCERQARHCPSVRMRTVVCVYGQLARRNHYLVLRRQVDTMASGLQFVAGWLSTPGAVSVRLFRATSGASRGVKVVRLIRDSV